MSDAAPGTAELNVPTSDQADIAARLDRIENLFLDHNDKRTPDHGNDRRSLSNFDWRGPLAIFSLIGALGLAFLQVSQGKPGDIPAWAATLVASVITYYFGSKSNGGSH